MSSVGITFEGRLDLGKFQRWMRQLLMEKGVDLFRSKGVLHFHDQAHPYVFQAVHMLMAGQLDEDRPLHPRLENRLIFIGRNLDRDMLNAGFNQCKV